MTQALSLPAAGGRALQGQILHQGQVAARFRPNTHVVSVSNSLVPKDVFILRAVAQVYGGYLVSSQNSDSPAAPADSPHLETIPSRKHLLTPFRSILI